MGVKYVDFNDSLVLETKTHYFDELHLNQQGVEKFNDALILWLQQEKLL
jgi:lysophospholipase L1-like esterase